MSVLFSTADTVSLKFLEDKTFFEEPFDGSHKSILKYAEKINSLSKTPLYSETRFKGNIGNKVSFLLIGNANMIFEGDLNCDILYLVKSKPVYPSDQIKTKHLLVLSETYKDYISSFTNYFHVGQFADFFIKLGSLLS